MSERDPMNVELDALRDYYNKTYPKVISLTAEVERLTFINEGLNLIYQTPLGELIKAKEQAEARNKGDLALIELLRKGKEQAEANTTYWENTTKGLQKKLEQAEADKEAMEAVMDAAEAFFPTSKSGDDKMGWMGRSSDTENFYCEGCGEKHLDYSKIVHKPHCRVFRLKQAFKAYKEETP